MTRAGLWDETRRQLAIDHCCAPEDFGRDGTLFFPLLDAPGRRAFPRGEQHLEMTTMGKSVVVSATEGLLPFLRAQLTGKTRDQAFSMPFVYGLSLYYLPALDGPGSVRPPAGYAFDWTECAGMEALYEHEGFRNAILYDLDSPRPDVLALAARKGGEIAAMAGASADSETLWQIGIDVLPAHRGRGLAAALVGMLTQEILARGKVPYYGTSASNIASQRVAHRAGYAPAWMCCYQGLFDGVKTSPTG